MYRGDKPIKQCSEDRLGRKLFSKELAESIINLSTTDTFAIGLYGTWGSGKTSVLNMTIQEINKLSDDALNSKKPVIIQFNPWNYSDADQLMHQFFNTLSNSLKMQKHDSKLESIGTSIQEYSDALEFADWVPIVGKYTALIRLIGKISGKTIKNIGEQKKKNIDQIKNDIIVELEKQQRKIIVIIDDIDRLSNDQIKMIFQLVNAVASFPNMIYVLSFDKEVVARALTSMQNCDGNEYLEKIIQVPFEIPMVPKEKLNKIFFGELDSVLSSYFNLDFKIDRERWDRSFWSIINPCLESVRDIKRLINCFQMKCNLCFKELDWIELLSITTLQVFFPKIFRWIIINKANLVGGLNPFEGISGVEQKENKVQQLKNFELLIPGKAEYMLESLVVLFPKFGRQVSYHYDYIDSDSLRTAHRIASEDRFNYYFSLSIDEIPIEADVFDRIIKTADEGLILAYYSLFITTGTFIDFLTNLRGVGNSISKERIFLLSKTLFSVLGKSDETSSGLIIWSADDHIESCITKLLTNLDNLDERYRLFNMAMMDMDINNLSGISVIINREELSHGRLAGKYSDESKQLLRLDDLLKLEQLFMERVKKIIIESSLLDTKSFFMPAYLWECYDETGYSKYISEELDASDINKCRFIACNAEKWTSMTKANCIGWTFSPSRFGKHLTVDSARIAIDTCRATGNFRSLPILDKEKIAAFMLYTSDIVNEKDSISQKKAQKLLSLWDSGSNIGDASWDETDD